MVGVINKFSSSCLADGWEQKTCKSLQNKRCEQNQPLRVGEDKSCKSLMLSLESRIVTGGLEKTVPVFVLCFLL